jgi:cellulose biosynthesis protein BcsQ
MTEPVPLQLKSEHTSYLFYGPPGSGKTTLAAHLAGSLPEGEKALILDVDRKLASMSNLNPDWVKKIDVWTPTATLSGKEIGIARVERYDSKKNVVPGTQGAIPKNPQGYLELVAQANKLLVDCPYSLVVLDTLSTTVEHLQRLICYHHQVSTFTLPLWGVFATNIEELRAGLLSLPCRKIFICHTRTSENEDTNEVRVLPSVPGQTGEKLVKDFNEAYFFLGKSGNPPIYRVLTSASRKYTCRTTLDLPGETSVTDLLNALTRSGKARP